MSNSAHKKKQSSSRRSSQRLEAANRAASQTQKKAGKIRRSGGTVSRARLADMTAELDGQFAATLYSDAKAVQSGKHWQDASRSLNMQSSDESVKNLADVLDSLL